MSNYQRLNDVIMWQITKRLETGQFQIQISRKFNVALSVVKQFKYTGYIETNSGEGCLRATKANEDCYLSIIKITNKSTTTSLVIFMWPQAVELQRLFFTEANLTESCLL